MFSFQSFQSTCYKLKDDFVEKTIKIATDLSLRKAFGAKAIETSRKFSTETIKEKWLKLLKDLETK